MKLNETAPSVADNDACPSAPVAAVITAAAASGLASFAADEEGDYKYEVAAISKNGESAPVQGDATITVVAGQEVTITIERGAVSGNDLTQGYRIYRTRLGELTAKKYLIKVIPSMGASTVYLDSNEDIPGLGKALIGQMDETTCTLRELSPMLKFPRATVASSIRWMQLYYNTPIIFRPRSWVIVKNIARLA